MGHFLSHTQKACLFSIKAHIKHHNGERTGATAIVYNLESDIGPDKDNLFT